MSRVIMGFVRHADYHQLDATPSAHQPFALTEKGIAQSEREARRLAEILSEQGWQLQAEFDSSNMLRAWQTARIFQQILQALCRQTVSICSHDLLAERSVGAVANLTAEQISELVATDPRYPELPQQWKTDSYFCLPFQGAESLSDAGQRVAAHILKQMCSLSRLPETQLKLFFGHGAAFRHAAYHLGILDFDSIACLSMYHAHPMLFEWHENGSWQHLSGEWKQRVTKAEAMD